MVTNNLQDKRDLCVTLLKIMVVWSSLGSYFMNI